MNTTRRYKFTANVTLIAGGQVVNAGDEFEAELDHVGDLLRNNRVDVSARETHAVQVLDSYVPEDGGSLLPARADVGACRWHEPWERR